MIFNQAHRLVCLLIGMIVLSLTLGCKENEKHIAPKLNVQTKKSIAPATVARKDTPTAPEVKVGVSWLDAQSSQLSKQWGLPDEGTLPNDQGQMQYVYFVIPGKTYASPDQKITFKLNNKNKKIDYIFIVDKQGTITNAYVAYNRVHLADYFKDQLPKK